MSESRRPHSSLAASSASHSLVESIGLRPCQRRIWLACFLNGSTCQATLRPRRRSSGGQDRVVLRPVEPVGEVLYGSVDSVDEGGVAVLDPPPLLALGRVRAHLHVPRCHATLLSELQSFGRAFRVRF